MEVIVLWFSLITGAISSIALPIILAKINKTDKNMCEQNEFNKEVGKIRTDIDESNIKMTKAERSLVRETAQAVKDGRSNGPLSKAIEVFDKAKDDLEIATEKQIAELKSLYNK